MGDKLVRDTERLPESKAKPEYPHEKVHVTTSGHRFEHDDTPGHERLFNAHRSGTYDEISPDGQKVECVVGNHYMYVKGTGVTTYDGPIDFKSSGVKIVSMGGILVEIVGKADIVIYGDANIVVAGKAKIVAEEILLSSERDINICAGRDVNIEAERDIKLKAKRNISKSAKGITGTADSIDLNSSGEEAENG